MDVARLLADLKAPDAEVRRFAIEDLGDAGEAAAIPHLVTCLNDPAVSVREAAADALVAIGGEAVGKAVIPLLYSENTALRNLATEILEQVGGECIEDLLALCSSPSADIRKFVVDILGKIGEVTHIENIAPIITCLADDNPNVAGAAAEALGKIGNTRAIKPLLEAMSGQEWLQCNVIDAIAQIGGREARQALKDINPENLGKEAAFFYSMAMERVRTGEGVHTEE